MKRIPPAAAPGRHLLALVAAVVTAVTSVLVPPTGARAQSTGAAEPKAPSAPPPYSLPWNLRPAAVGNVFRADSVVAGYENAAGRDGTTFASLWLLSHKFNDRLMGMARWGYVHGSPPVGESGDALVNPVLAVTYLVKPRPHLRVATFLGLALPLGQGGGDRPDPATAAARSAGVLARSAMDNAMFAVNDLTVFPGVGVAWIKDGWTVQGEATLLQLTRVRGKQAQPDSAKTNFTCGAHAGYFFGPRLSLGGELRYQRWLSTPSFVEANPALRDNLSLAVGPRLHFKLSQRVWFRPGVSYARGLNGAIDDLDYDIVQIDLPFSF